MVNQIFDEETKRQVSRKILESLPEWFGIKESREEYILNSAKQAFFVAKVEDKIVGFLCLKETGKSTVEAAVLGVLKEYQRQGFGKQLFSFAYNYAKKKKYEFIQVKTVAVGHYETYDQTNAFYQSLGFKEFEIFPTLWDKSNPCQVYVMDIK